MLHHKLFQKGGTLPNLYEASVILIPKLDSDAKGTLQTNIPYEYRCGNPQQNTVKLNPATYGKNYIS